MDNQFLNMENYQNLKNLLPKA